MRIASLLTLVAGIGLTAGGCPPPCAPVSFPAIEVNLLSANNAAPISGATLIVTDGEFTDVLVETEGDPGNYTGAVDRPGNYTLMVDASGFESRTINGLSVGMGECFVDTLVRQVQLTPQ